MIVLQFVMVVGASRERFINKILEQVNHYKLYDKVDVLCFETNIGPRISLADVVSPFHTLINAASSSPHTRLHFIYIYKMTLKVVTRMEAAISPVGRH